jgi:CTP:molybdopterin cytidylyltransferase MocA
MADEISQPVPSAPGEARDTMSCSAIILAAGAARRWGGGPKALAPWRGRPLIDHVCGVARDAGCAPIYRVLGAHRAEIEAASPSRPDGTRTIFNPAWADGIGASLACAVRELAADPAAANCAGLVVMLCDQALVDAALLRALWTEHQRGGRGIVFSDHDAGVLGPPAFFSRMYWPELASLRGDEGARRVARAHPDAVASVAAPGARHDMDTREDYERILIKLKPDGAS